jgi:hypothetical protein
MKSFLLLLSIFSSFIFFTGCSDKQDESFTVAPASSYFNLQAGKYIIYRVDSLAFTQQGRAEEIHVYQEKDLVNGTTTDAMGRPSYVVYRYIRDSAGLAGWNSLGTYLVTPANGNIEVYDDNMRVVKLAAPVKQGYSWKGNTFLATEPYYYRYPANFGNDDNMGDWDFVIARTGETININGKTYNDVVTVNQVDERNYPDTLLATNNQVQIGATMQSVWLIGNATDTVKINATTPRSGALTIYNHTSFPARIGALITPAGKGRSFEYFNSGWRYANNRDSIYDDPPFASKSYSVEKYAKGVGLVYQELTLWEYQPNIGSTPFKVGFGIKRTILDHN